MKTKSIFPIRAGLLLLTCCFALPSLLFAQALFSNVAMAKTATASSSDNPSHAAQFAVDGNLNTRFSSNSSDNEWLSIDLGKQYLIDRVIIGWEKSVARDFDVIFSLDGSFTDLPAASIQLRNQHIQGAGILSDTIQMKSNTIARYVRMQGIHRGAGGNYSIWEIQVLGATSSASLFPVSITGFTASAQNNNTNLLEWSTITEFSNAGFLIERSGDAVNFNSIVSIAPVNNGSVVTHYSYTDKQPLPGRCYYRLKQTWLDGKIGYSPVLTVYGTAMIAPVASGASVYPVPVSDHLSVVCSGTSGDNVSITLYTMGGQPVHAQKNVLQGNSQTITVNRPASLQPGQYFVQVRVGSNVSMQTVVLQ